MHDDFLKGTLGRSGKAVHRLGLSASHRPGRQTVYRALDLGINLFFCYGFDTQMIAVLREVLKGQREKNVVVTGAYNFVLGHANLRCTLEKRLRQLRTDYIDVFLFLGVLKEKHLTGHVRDQLLSLRQEGKVHCVGLSTHDVKLAGRLAAEGIFDTLMVRYNAAHRDAEQQIFPHLDTYKPGLISYTATRWTQLLRRPRGCLDGGRIPTPGMCYRFVLSNPQVDVCLTAPSNFNQLEDNLDEIGKGPLDAEEMAFMRRFGDAVRGAKRRF